MTVVFRLSFSALGDFAGFADFSMTNPGADTDGCLSRASASFAIGPTWL